MNMLRMLSAGAVTVIGGAVWLALTLLGVWLLEMESAVRREEHRRTTP